MMRRNLLKSESPRVLKEMIFMRLTVIEMTE